MKAAVFVEPGKVEVKEVEKPKIDGENQAIIRVIRASVCGSDLWWFRGIADRESGSLISHEAIGVVEEVSDDVTDINIKFIHICAAMNGIMKGKYTYIA